MTLPPGPPEPPLLQNLQWAFAPGRFMDRDCITTLHHLNDGATVMASRVIGQDIFAMSVVGVDTTGAETLTFRDAAAGIERELIVLQDRIVAVTAQGQWDELGDIHRSRNISESMMFASLSIY